MALQVSVDEAKTDFSKLLARVREGEEVIIATGEENPLPDLFR